MAGTVSFKQAKAAAKAVTPPTPAEVVQNVDPAPRAVPGGFIVSDHGGGNIEPLAAGVYQAVVVGLYDIGSVEGAFGIKRKLVLTWEVPSETIEVERDGETVKLPRNLSQTYTMSLNEKAKLRQDLEAIRCKRLTKEEARAFDVSCLLGMNAQVQVVQTEKEGKVYANLETVMACPKGMAAAVPSVSPVMFAFAGLEKADETAIPDACPRWVRKKIMASPEWAAIGGSPMIDDRD